VTETPVGETFSMCLASNGEYGVDKGLIFSYPCRTENGKIKVIEGIKHNEFGQEKFKLTLDELRGERDAVKSLNLI
jgi:malate dehydrogenase